MELLKSKLRPPIEPNSLTERPRLLGRLDEAERCGLSILVAPAGYGKTSLLAQWHQALKARGRNPGWLTVDSFEGDAIGLLTYVAAALTTAGVKLNPKIERLAQNNAFATVDYLTEVIIEGLENAAAPVFLCMDDIHLLDADAFAALGRVIRRAPPNTRVIVASRTLPDLQLARARVSGQLVELHAEDLRFSDNELRSYIAGAGEVGLADGELDALAERTEGWIAGIKLAVLALRRGAAAGDILASLTGSSRSISDFFAEEVIASQSDEVRDFLLATCVLDRFCPELCDAVTGRDNARSLLTEIEANGLFLLQLDNERSWYRYHHLFSDFLRRRLNEQDPGAERRLRLAASDWFWEADLVAEAIGQALRAGAPERAAELLELRCQDMTYTGKFRLVPKFAAQIPRKVLERFPLILLILAWQKTRALRFEEASTLLNAARRRLGEIEAEGNRPPEEMRHLHYLLLHRETVLDAAHDNDPAGVEKQCLHLLEQFPEERHPYLNGAIYGHLLWAKREQYKLDDLEEICARAQGIVNRSIYTFASVGVQANLGPSLFFAGKTDAARKALEQGREEGVRFSGQRSSAAALPTLPLVEIVYESNDLEQTAELLDEALPFARELGLVDHLMPAFLTRARLKEAQGDTAGAFEVLDEAMGIALERDLERFRLALVAERVKLLIQEGNPDEAVRAAELAGIAARRDEPLPQGGVTTADELRAVVFTRIALTENRIAEGLHLAKHWRSFCTGHGAIRSLVRWHLLCAQLNFVGGEQRAAQRALREALSHGAYSNLVRSFLDEGRIIHTLLSTVEEQCPEAPHAADTFARSLLDAFENKRSRPLVDSPATAAEGLYGKLSAREREILSMVGHGLRNREIADKLGMTEGSVKWYMQQVYDKVGTRRRLQAVERARQFGMIP